MRRLILASTSPRRYELLTALGVEFIVCPPHVDEDPLPDELPLDTQCRITRAKADAAVKRMTVGEYNNDAVEIEFANPQIWPVIIACDTTVLLDGGMLNKPADADDARRMLCLLRGREHQVQSTIVVRRGEQESVDVVKSNVRMRKYTHAEIEAYIDSGDAFDKAGGYAVQHAMFQPVQDIQGCPLNVIGLPLCHLRARVTELPDCSHVCETYFAKPCPQRLDDPLHLVSGRVNRYKL